MDHVLGKSLGYFSKLRYLTKRVKNMPEQRKKKGGKKDQYRHSFTTC